MIAVCGIGSPSGLLNSATTAYQSANPPMVAASANAATKPNTGCTFNNSFATANSASVAVSTSVASALTRRSSAARWARRMRRGREGSWRLSTIEDPHPEERRLRRVSKDEGPNVASWFETAQSRLLTKRGWPDLCGHGTKRRPARSGPLKLSADRQGSGSLVVDLGEVVLGRLGTVGDELAEIFGGRLRPRDEHFAARTGHVGLDLDRFVQRLRGRQLVDAGDESLEVMIVRLLAVAADLGGLADGISSGSFDHG